MSDRNVTETYEQRAIDAFVRWYLEHTPTISDASCNVSIIAREATENLSPAEVIQLLQEHRDWVYQRPFNCDGNSPGDLVRGHLLQHLEHVIQVRGIQALLEARTMQTLLGRKDG